MSELTHGEQGLLPGTHNLYMSGFTYLYMFFHFNMCLGLGVSERTPTIWNVLGENHGYIT